MVLAWQLRQVALQNLSFYIAVCPVITVSIVSHGHGELVSRLLEDLVGCTEVSSILLTLNVPEEGIDVPDSLADKVVLIKNPLPLGFGANHNQAFRQVRTAFFCILNPDIRIPHNPFSVLMSRLDNGECGLAAPAILTPSGKVDDSARYLPTPWSVLHKVMGGQDGRYSFELGGPDFSPDWVGGMFMLVRAEAFRSVGGFDERYFLYYEDVDLCCRLRLAGHRLLLSPAASAIHDARRASHRNLRFLKWHLASMIRFFSSAAFWSLWPRKLLRH